MSEVVREIWNLDEALRSSAVGQVAHPGGQAHGPFQRGDPMGVVTQRGLRDAQVVGRVGEELPLLLKVRQRQPDRSDGEQVSGRSSPTPVNHQPPPTDQRNLMR
ncbi:MULTISPECIES: hypothetical protein [unclassified Kitasatospora]|uniref:hypothetical protein n=1 Tax=unclassified Kitasatospora TaxID=2633591 RepID=UPI002473B520|nr:hypothetical protein [Kitasatospora sp. MAP12-44]